VLQPVGGEVDTLRAPIQQPHVGHPEVELRELARHALEAHHQLRWQLLLLGAENAVERALAQRDALLAELPQHLQRRRLRILRKQLPRPLRDLLGKRRTPDAASLPRSRVVRLFDGRLLRDPLHGARRDAHLLRDLLRGEARAYQGLYGVSVDHPDHPPSPAGGGQQPCTERRKT
jgi:hypothetical protein